jgi:hypothetical protein
MYEDEHHKKKIEVLAIPSPAVTESDPARPTPLDIRRERLIGRPARSCLSRTAKSFLRTGTGVSAELR